MDLTVRTRRDKVAQWRFQALCHPDHGKPNPELACSAPVEIFAFGYPDAVSVDQGFETDGALSHRIAARCRKCEGCLKHRARLWTARAITEVAVAPRTWFGTLTLAPVHAFRFRLLADRLSERQGSPWSLLEAPEQFQKVAAQVGPDLQRFLKRIRKQSGAVLRYLLVLEAHKSGVPHWHILLHECSGTISKRLLEEQWKLGFSHWRLCDPDAAYYACKYLAKSSLARVRASQSYGSPPGLPRSDLALIREVAGAKARSGRD
jgi:hypothetical protein